MDAKTLCLGALTLGDASGYEIRKMFEEGPFSHFHYTNYGSIYPALGKLLDQQFVTCDEVPQEGKPDKKIYSLSPLGREAFQKGLRKKPSPDKVRSEAIYMMFFGAMIEKEDLSSVYDEYLENAQTNAEMLRGLDCEGVSPSRLFSRGLGLAFYESITKYMQENRDLLFDGHDENVKGNTGL